MAYNLSRNSRVFVTTNLNTATGKVSTSGLTAQNCFEIQVLDGFSFSQNTNQTTVAINEAGSSPIRGQRAFNTALNPVDISFSTYIRPKNPTAGTEKGDERTLWAALFGTVAIDAGLYNEAGTLSTNTPATITGTTTAIRATTTAGQFTATSITVTPPPTAGLVYTLKNVTAAGGSLWEAPLKVTSYAGNTLIGEFLTPPAAAATTASPVLTNARLDRSAWVNLPTHGGRTIAAGIASTGPSNKNQLLPIGFIFIVDNVTYLVHNAAMDGATIDFGLDAIAMVAWTAKGTELEQLASNGTAAAGTFGGGLTGTYAQPGTDTTNYITNKISTMTLQSNLYGTGGTSYQIALTGGSLAIANNINYVTPANIGVVNKPIGYFTGARSISGSVNAYMRTGTSNDAGTLLKDMLTAAATAAETKYRLQVEVGGASNPLRVELDMPGVVIGLPSVDIQDVVSTTINFNAQGVTNIANTTTYDMENTNDLTLRYFSNV